MKNKIIQFQVVDNITYLLLDNGKIYTRISLEAGSYLIDSELDKEISEHINGEVKNVSTKRK